MAQGAVKKSKAAAPSKQKPAVQRGTRVIKPKKAGLIKQNQLRKKHSSGLAALTEKSLAQRAGHLEMLRGGKKDGGKRGNKDDKDNKDNKSGGQQQSKKSK